MALNRISDVKLNTVSSKKQVKYLNKDYSEFKSGIIDFAKFYFPDSYQDFNETSPGTIFIEMAAYIGDVLSYYTDNAFKENLLAYAEEKENIISIAQGFGYRVRNTTPATTIATLSQLVPATSEGALDPTYLLKVGAGSSFSSNIVDAVSFISSEIVDFRDPTDRVVQIYTLDDLTGLPTVFLVSKNVKLTSAKQKVMTFTVGDPQKFMTIQIPDKNVIEIDSIVDEQGNTWHQVDNLSQDYIFQDTLVSTSDTNTPLYKVKTIKTNRRFITRINRDLNTEITFGSGTGDLDDVFQNIDYKAVYDSQYLQNITNTSLDVLNFTNSNSFGLAPANTILTISYFTGGGLNSNISANKINIVNSARILNETRTLSSSELGIFNAAIDSLSILNRIPATGGGDPPSVEEIRRNAMGFLNAQARVVTAKDYETRVLSMPPKYGTVAKAFVVNDEQINQIIDFTRVGELTVESLDPEDDIRYVNNSPINTNINLYVIGYDSDKRLTELNSTIKNNIKVFLEEYRMLTDKVNILDTFVVNIGVEYSIIVYKTYNIYDVLARTSDKIKSMFNIDNWQINQPIIISDIELLIASVDGVQSVTSCKVFNKYRQRDGGDYRPYRYNIDNNTIGGIIYPSADPCVFELRYPESDIIGTATQ